MKKYVSVFIIIIITLLILSCGPKLTPYGEWKVLVEESNLPGAAVLTKSGNDSIISIGGGVYFEEFDEYRISNEVWEYDLLSDNWTQKNPTGDEFPVIYQSTSAYGGVVNNHNKVVVFGGLLMTYIKDVIRNDTDRTWEYDVEDDSWSETTKKSIKPGIRCNHAMTYMKGNEVLMHGGTSKNLSYDYDDTWIYNTNTSSWEEVILGGDKPCFRIFHEMASNEKDTVVLFGGADAMNLRNDTWEFSISEREWTKIDTRTAPPERWFFGMTYIGDNKIIIFGGDVAEYHDSNDVWIYDIDEKNWQEVEIVGGNIEEREDFDMVTISNGITILQGGCNDNTSYFDQTYQFTFLGYE